VPPHVLVEPDMAHLVEEVAPGHLVGEHGADVDPTGPRPPMCPSHLDVSAWNTISRAGGSRPAISKRPTAHRANESC
jgi:hypothetical protein